MSIQYTLAFVCLVIEVIAFVLLSLPFGHKQKAQAINFVSTSPAFKPVRTLIMVVGFLILILFFDALNRAVLNPPSKVDLQGQPFTEHAVNSKKFFAQRNLYLTGSTLLMFYATTQYYSLMLFHLRTKAELEAKLKVQQRATEGTPKREGVARSAEAEAVTTIVGGSPARRGEEIELEGLRKRS
ncbi:hypothetical protein M427DRAFT_30418 [Gonapodya prolifera JEL478]|uniref:Endoplasmic reticulum transmembrane protein n=1 Tax=Gonapodya prolifera (strain JEL478) TaxID=1344416 RepID=A0A139AM49_GONPJ|nr:hypothetical protein M427DRAFT_30418 [Gonapodya prolifera JEL478]|eukprot:KXS17634.1 hypothetical protein M427DRAFT_30418 [Gonapodya prolifera JEL478]